MGVHEDEIAKARKPVRAASIAISAISAACLVLGPLYLFGIMPSGILSAILGIPEDGTESFVGVISLMVTGLVSLVVGIFGIEVGGGNDKAGLAAWVFGVGLFCEAFTTVAGIVDSVLRTYSLACALLMLFGLVELLKLRKLLVAREREEEARRSSYRASYGRESSKKRSGKKSGSAGSSSKKGRSGSGPKVSSTKKGR